MADINFLPREKAPRQQARKHRESVLVDIGRWPAIAARVKLEEHLLAGTCPHGMPEQGVRVGLESEGLLLQLTRERFGGEHALLRVQAVTALAKLDSKAARARLHELAMDQAEHDPLRLAALAGIMPVGGAILEQLATDSSPLVRAHVERVRGEASRERHGQPRRVPAEADTEQDDTL